MNTTAATDGLRRTESGTVGAPVAPSPARWGAVFALALCVATLIASEFMPVSLITPISADLRISDGTAGQAIAVSGAFAVLTSLAISTATRGVDRRRVLLTLAVLMLVSGLLVALAPDVGLFMAGRALIGIVIGGSGRCLQRRSCVSSPSTMCRAPWDS